jgi:hypothetical protein
MASATPPLPRPRSTTWRSAFATTADVGARAPHATLLAICRVPIAGGGNDDVLALDSSEVYDPASGKFSRAGSMTDARSLHAATLLADGQVLIAGGFADPSADAVLEPLGGAMASSTDSAEVFDPATGEFTAVGSMLSPALRIAVTLRDGRVMVLGGRDQDVEVFDPASDTFSRAGSLTVVRELGGAGDPATAYRAVTATVLLDGRVLVIGGRRGDARPAEVFR